MKITETNKNAVDEVVSGGIIQTVTVLRHGGGEKTDVDTPMRGWEWEDSEI